jgi:hypothetical protein
MKTFRKILAIVAGLATFVGLFVFMLALNDWGQSAPSEVTQLFWALSMVSWPFLIGTILWPKG